jgi:hypothetical protein
MFLDKVSGTSPHLPHATPQRRAPARIATICTCAAALVLVATASAAESGKSSSAIGSWDIAKWAGGVLWSAVVWFVGRWFLQKKHRTQDAIKSCRELRKLLGKWLDELRKAFAPEATRTAALKKLEEFMLAHDFEPRLQNELGILEQEPACSWLLARVSLFHAEALDAKGKIWTLLQKPDAEYEFAKAGVLLDVEKAYEAASRELDRTLEFLERSANRLLPLPHLKPPPPV